MKLASKIGALGLFVLLAGLPVVIYDNPQDFEIHQPSYNSMDTPERMLYDHPLSLHFQENLGQVDNENVLFYGAQIDGHCQMAIGFAESGLRFCLTTQVSRQSPIRYPSQDWDDLATDHSSTTQCFSLVFDNSNPVLPQGSEPFAYPSSYFLGNNPSGWVTSVQSYGAVVYENLYDEIDLVYRLTDQGLKYEFIVWPSGNPDVIRCRYTGVEDLSFSPEKSLVVKTAVGALVDSGLYIYQETDSGAAEIQGRFSPVTSGPTTYGFSVDCEYDPAFPLIIDPTLSFATFVGGSMADWGFSMVLDSADNIYLCGETTSTDFPVSSGANDTTYNGGSGDVFVVKMSPNGTAILQATYVGGSGLESGWDIALDESENIVATGYTASGNFPVTEDAYDSTINGENDAFILKLNNSCNHLLFSTYIGGAYNDYGTSLAIDAVGTIHTTGFTESADFPTTAEAYDESYNGGCDAYVLGLSADGSELNYSTFIGGSNMDTGNQIVTDTEGSIIVTGRTLSVNLPISQDALDSSLGGESDAFVLELKNDGSELQYLTFVGGSSCDCGNAIAIDPSGGIILGGYTNSFDFPTTDGSYDERHNGGYDAFILRLYANETGVSHSTFLGGGESDNCLAITLDDDGDIYTTGTTRSVGFPTTAWANDTTFNGDRDVYIVKLSADVSVLLHSSFLGGSSTDEGEAIVLDSSDRVIIAGFTNSADFPTTAGGADIAFNLTDAFVVGLTLDTKDIIVSQPADAFINQSSTSVAYSLRYNASLAYGIMVYLDGVANNSNFPSGSVWGPLSEGLHNLTIVAMFGESVGRKTLLFTVDTTLPDLDSPTDIEYEEGTEGHMIAWTAGDINPAYYEIWDNTSCIQSRAWVENGTVYFDVDGLSLANGTIAFTLIVYDTAGNNALDVVHVRSIDTALPTLSSPPDIEYTVGESGNVLAWTGSDVHPAWYEVYRNGTLIQSGDWDGSNITISVDGLSTGVYEFAVVVLDTSNNNATDSVLVTVLLSPSQPVTLLAAAGMGIIALIAIVVLGIKRMKS